MMHSTNKLCNSLMYDDDGRLALLQHENIVMPLFIIVKLLNPTLQIAGEQLDNRQKSEDTNIYIYTLLCSLTNVSGQIRPCDDMIAVMTKSV